MNFIHIVGNSHQSRHRPERRTPEIHVEPRNNHTNTTVGQLFTHIHQTFVKKLCFIYSHHIHFAGHEQDTTRWFHRCRSDGSTVVRHHIFFGIACIYFRFEYFYPQLCKICPLQPADQLLCLARKHGSANYLNTSSSHLVWMILLRINHYFSKFWILQYLIQ